MKELPSRQDIQDLTTAVRKLTRLLRWLIPAAVIALLGGSMFIFRLTDTAVVFFLVGGGLLVTLLAIVLFGAKVYHDFKNRDYKFRI